MIPLVPLGQARSIEAQMEVFDISFNTFFYPCLSVSWLLVVIGSCGHPVPHQDAVWRICLTGNEQWNLELCITDPVFSDYELGVVLLCSIKAGLRLEIALDLVSLILVIDISTTVASEHPPRCDAHILVLELVTTLYRNACLGISIAVDFGSFFLFFSLGLYRGRAWSDG